MEVIASGVNMVKVKKRRSSVVIAKINWSEKTRERNDN